MKLVPDKKYSNMYRVQWPDGGISVATVDPPPWLKGGHYGFYNKTRAKELLKRSDLESYEVGKTYRDPHDSKYGVNPDKG